jgi:hypothetical protein
MEPALTSRTVNIAEVEKSRLDGVGAPASAEQISAIITSGP